MKKYLALSLMIALAVSMSQVAQAAAPRGGKENEANRLARDGAESFVARQRPTPRAQDLP